MKIHHHPYGTLYSHIYGRCFPDAQLPPIAFLLLRVAYSRLNGDARKKSKRLPMVPGGIYSPMSGRAYLIVGRGKKCSQTKANRTLI